MMELLKMPSRDISVIVNISFQVGNWILIASQVQKTQIILIPEFQSLGQAINFSEEN